MSNISPSIRPTRDLMLQLPLLQTTSDLKIDYQATNSALLLQLAENAETLTNTINLGLSAVGTILAHAAPEAGREIPSSAIEALGWFMAETSDAAATAFCLATACRRYAIGTEAPAPENTTTFTF